MEGWLTFDLYQYIFIHSLFQRHHKPYIIFIPVGGWVGILEFSRCKRRWRKFCVNKSANVCNINTAELYINICPWHQFRQEKPFAIEGNKRACKHTHTHTHTYTHTHTHTNTHRQLCCKIYSIYNEQFRYKIKTLYSCLTFSNLLFWLSQNYKYHLLDFIFHSLSLWRNTRIHTMHTV